MAAITGMLGGVGTDHIGLVLSDGSSLVITADQIRAHYVASQADDRQADTSLWVKREFISFAGDDNLDGRILLFSFETGSGMPTQFELNFGDG